MFSSSQPLHQPSRRSESFGGQVCALRGGDYGTMWALQAATLIVKNPEAPT
jgi:hypothetical protein